MKKKLIALFEYGWLTDDEINILEESNINVKIYEVNDEPEMRIELDGLTNKQKRILYSILKSKTIEEIKNKEYTWLILYQ